eukprot:1464488-Pleurochrysis_carterae.AAC.1
MRRAHAHAHARPRAPHAHSHRAPIRAAHAHRARAQPTRTRACAHVPKRSADAFVPSSQSHNCLPPPCHPDAPVTVSLHAVYLHIAILVASLDPRLRAPTPLTPQTSSSFSSKLPPF